MILVVLVLIRFLFVSSYPLDDREPIRITKCCASAERLNSQTKLCIPNINQVKFGVDTVFLNIAGSKWIVDSNSFHHAFRYELCSGNITRNYRVTQTGQLIEYTGEKSYYQFYNKYCVDVDHKTGEKIAIICDDRLVVKKCCGVTSILIEQDYGNFECRPTENAIYLNDLTGILFGNEEKKNIEFAITDQLKNLKELKNFERSHFVFDENQNFIQFDSQTDFCLDKLDKQWIVLAESDKTLWLIRISITIFIVLVLFVTVYLSYILKRKITGKRLLNPCVDDCSFEKARKASFKNDEESFRAFFIRSKSKDMEIVPTTSKTEKRKVSIVSLNSVQNKKATKASIECNDEKGKCCQPEYKKANSYKNVNLEILSDELKGQLYQILVLMSVLETNNLTFNAQSESDSTGKFDDIILKRQSSKAQADFLLQAQYRVDSGNLKFEDFFEANSWLNLKKYFNSYYLRGQHLNFIFCTNLKAPDCKNVCDSLYLEELNQEDLSFTRFGSNEKYFVFTRKFIDYLKNKLPDLATNENLESFVKKVTLVFEFDVNNIHKKLTENFEIESVEVCQYIVESTFLKWIESVPTRKSFDFSKYKIFQNQIQNELFKTNIHKKLSSIYEAENQYKLNSLNYELSEFLSSESSTSKVCYVKTEPDESFYIAAKIYATLKKKFNDSSFLVVQTSWEDRLFQKVLDTTISDSSVKILVIENNSGKNLNLVESKFSRDQKIVIVHHGITTSSYNTKKITHERIDIGRLDEASLKKISIQKVNFQGNEVSLEELIDLTNREIFSSILLTDILKLKSLSKPYSCDQNFYIQRELTRPRQNNKNTEESIKEEELLEELENVLILADSAGSGKTTFLLEISKKLNQKFHNEWIIFVDLNRYRSRMNEKSFESHEQFKEFLKKDVLGLKNNLEIKIFDHALEDCRGRNVNILLDEFAGSKSEKQLVQVIMKVGLKRLFITTRPEFGECLKNLTSSLRMKFIAFDKICQERLLSNLLKDNSVVSETECKKLVSKVVSKISESEKAFHHNFGIPLVLKMLAEILSSFEDKKRLDEVDKISFNIYQLYQKYFDVKMRAYYKSDERNLTSSFESFKTEKIPKLQNLAVQQIFPEFKTSAQKIAIKDDDLFYISSPGFIQQIKQRTLAEFLTVENLTTINIADSMWEKLFHDPEFSTFRCFLASWMETDGIETKLQKVHEKVLKNCKSYQNSIEDKNVRSFEVFLKTLLRNQ
jgi:hypothetical protein